LRKQDVDRLLHVKIHKPKYVPAYAPLIDRAVIPDKPLNLMENVQLFGGYEGRREERPRGRNIGFLYRTPHDVTHK